ncbi:hypothetical protein [Carnobacterium mobile]|uniref:hypothetical protein n=1 Tax=Carnobacterium mobile TaxID=2750 RepID=UPI00186644C2|nr:hypothetical protein [Carnobacterium mobile]
MNFEETLKKAKNSWPEDKECQVFVNNAEKILNKEEIPYLVISDYNTFGLKGAGRNTAGTPWSSLVKEVGSSNKGADSTGSFGIGKAAPFACSELRTVFYSTYVNGEGSHSIGVANLVSYDLPNGYTAQGVGFYEGSDGQAINGALPFNKEDQRENPGTDICVMGFDAKDKFSGWEKEVILSVIENFMVSIIEGKLVVKVSEYELNKDSLDEFVSYLDDKTYKNTKDYYEVLTSEDSLKLHLTDNFNSEFSIKPEEGTLYILKKKDANRKVLLTRKTGMKVFEKANISGSIQFTGVFIAKGKELNGHLKVMENPAHTEWSAERHTNKTYGKKLLKTIYRFLKDSVVNNFQETFDSEVDAHNMNQYLPDTSEAENGLEEKYGMTQKIKEVIIKDSKITPNPSSTGKEVKKKKKKKKQSPVPSEEGIPEYFGVGPGFPEKDNKPGPNPGPEPNPNPSPGPNPGPNPSIDSNTSGEERLTNQMNQGESLEDEVKKAKNKVSCQLALIENNKQAGSYVLIIQSNKDILNPIIELKMIGESQDSKPIVVKANKDSVLLKTEKNLIQLDELNKNNSTKVAFQLSMKERVRLEVNIYAG